VSKPDIAFGINTGFAVNRYPEPEEWVRIIGEELGLDTVQMTADLLNPDLPAGYRAKQVERIRRACDRYGVRITSTFTGAFTRVNHLAHPDEDMRRHWVAWFKRFVEQSVDLGARAMGSHFGIFSTRENRDSELRALRRRQNIEGWHEIGAYAREQGLDCLLWEPMSIAREQGETIAEARRLQDDVNAGAPIPFRMCLDVDHGDLASANPDDTDPHAWLRAFSADAAQVHLKQSSIDKGAHWPFTRQFNDKGRIRAGEVLATMASAGYGKTEFLLEFSFREREPTDSTVVEQLKESVAYWREHLSP